MFHSSLRLSDHGLIIHWSLGALFLLLCEMSYIFEISFLFTWNLIQNMWSRNRRFVCIRRWIPTKICTWSRSQLGLWDRYLIDVYLFEHLWEIITVIRYTIVITTTLYYSIVTIFAIGNRSLLVVLAIRWGWSILGRNSLINFVRTISFSLDLLRFGSKPINIRYRTWFLLFAM